MFKLETYLLFAVLSLLTGSLAANENLNIATKCKDHPAYKASLNPVLVSSWAFPSSLSTSEQLAYLPKHQDHMFSPVGGNNPNKYRDLDLFHTAMGLRDPSFRIFFNRRAKVYLFLDVPNSAFDEDRSATLQGWRREGWARRTRGAGTITFGVHQTLTKSMTRYAYVFSKLSTGDNSVDIPQTMFLKQRVAGVSVPGSYNLWIAEADGSPSPPVGKFNGMTIRPNRECPAALHAAWVAKDKNRADRDTRGRMFRTWHPQWDPCWWCAYNHEHGSSPKALMNYEPTFDYTAWKDGRADESDEGFKGFVLRYDKYMIYFSLHGKQSSLRRTMVQFHTITLVIKDRVTDELYLEIQQKGDFGFQGVQLRNGDFLPINAGQQSIRDAQDAAGAGRAFRSVNVVDEGNLDARFRFRGSPILGLYEFWSTLPMCTKAKSRTKLLQTEFKLVNTGIKSLQRADTSVKLGRRSGGKLFQNTGLNRSMSAKELKIGARYCPEGKSGRFYTDVRGQRIVSGPGRTAVKQFVKPGFEMVLNGRFETVDTWVGLHIEGARGFFVDNGYGVDPENN